MRLLYQLGKIVDEAKEEYEKTKVFRYKKLIERKGKANKSIIALGDYSSFIEYLKGNGYENSIQMIYVDPPFFLKANYAASFKIDNRKFDMFAYEDKWNNDAKCYIKDMTIGLMKMKDLLKDDGVIAVHLDWHAVHYARLILDEIFGADNFINEIIWQYKSGGSSKKSFARKHDNILVYGKTKNYKFNSVKEKSYNRNLKPYKFKGVNEYKDEIGWYTLVNARDVWQIDMVGRTSKERTGYATQKPKALIKRFIEAFTDEEDIVADFFAGSGTTLSCCIDFNRSCMSCDINPMAISFNLVKLVEKNNSFEFIWDEKYDINIGNLDVKKNKNNIKLIKYEPKIKKEDFNACDFEFIMDLIKNKPTKLINYVNIDLNYDGNNHKESLSLRRKSNEILDYIELKDDTFSDIHIVSVDIFGRISETTIMGN